MSKRSRKKIPTDIITAQVSQLNHEGRGITHINGKTTFIFGALPDETINFQYTRCHSKLDEANTIEVLAPSESRVTPQCKHFGICGGCSLQHMSPNTQREHKLNVLLEHFEHQAQCAPQQILPALYDEPWGYRRRARLSVKFVEKKNSVLVGFRERNSSFVAKIEQCETLHPSVGHKIRAISDCLMQLETKSSIPQIEVAIGDTITALIIRHLVPLPEADTEKLVSLSKEHQFQLYLQPKSHDSIHCIYPSTPEKLFYTLPESDIKIYFKPGQFTQINQAINKKMITRAIELLDLNENDTVLDLFCGIGNFSLPIARKVKMVTGVEGSSEAITQAKENANINNLINTHFYVADLSTNLDDQPWANQQYNKILLDPARAGAKELIHLIPQWSPNRIVYVSCNPITLARDTQHLLQLGYQLEKAGVMDMFPHTEHIEAIALFTKK